MKTEYIVKAYEEELGAELFIVTVHEGTTINEVENNFAMAKKYAWVFSDEEPDGYDEHFDKMVRFKEESNGMYTFNYYLEEFCGYKIKPLVCDFEYEW